MKSETHNIDCLEWMKAQASSSLSYIITSPPYNLGEGMEGKGGLRVGHKNSKWQSSLIQNGYKTYSDDLPYTDYVKWQQTVLIECFRLLDDAGAIFYNHKPRIVKNTLRTPLNLIGDLPLKQIIIWYRKSGMNFLPSAYMPACEWILLIAKPNFRLRDRSASGLSDVWEITPENRNPHPAPFPYELPRLILESVAKIHKPVYDPFSGSGTVKIAAHDYGYDFVGTEISKQYCEMSDERFARHIAQANLFTPAPSVVTQDNLFV